MENANSCSFKENHDIVLPDPPPKPPDIGSKSFKEALGLMDDGVVVESKADENMVHIEEQESEDVGNPEIPFILPPELKAKVYRTWKTSIILKVVGSQIAFNLFQRRLQGLWKPKGSFQLIDLGHEFFIAKFEREEDMMLILGSGPWFLGSQYIATMKWIPDFHPATARILTMAVWIRLNNLPMEYYDSEVLWHLAKKVGKPVKIDAITLEQSRGRFARICVEINVDKPLVHSINCGSFQQKVQYEGLSLLCFRCGRVGHDQMSCSSTANLQDQQLHAVNNMAKQDNYGSWMLVTKRPMRRMGQERQDFSLRGKVNNNGAVTANVNHVKSNPIHITRFNPAHGRTQTDPTGHSRNSATMTSPSPKLKEKNPMQNTASLPQSSKYTWKMGPDPLQTCTLHTLQTYDPSHPPI